MQTVINTFLQSNLSIRKTTTITTGLSRVSGVYRDNFHTGTFSLVLQDIKELTPAYIVGTLGKMKTTDNTLDIQGFVSDLTKLIHQLTRRLVVKVVSLVGDVLRELCKSRNYLATVGTAFFLTCYRALKAFKFLLRFAVQLWWLDFLTVRIDIERLQTKVNPYRGVITRQTIVVGQDARKHDVPAVCLLLEPCRLNFAFNGPVHFKFNVTNSHEVRFVLREFSPVAVRELYAIKPAVPAKARIARRFSLFNTTEEGFHRTVKAFKGLLARVRVCFSKIRVSLPVLSETLTLLSKGNCTIISFVNVLSFCKSIIVQMTMRIQQGKHIFSLSLRWICSIFVRFNHYLDTQYYNRQAERTL